MGFICIMCRDATWNRANFLNFKIMGIIWPNNYRKNAYIFPATQFEFLDFRKFSEKWYQLPSGKCGMLRGHGLTFRPLKARPFR